MPASGTARSPGRPSAPTGRHARRQGVTAVGGRNSKRPIRFDSRISSIPIVAVVVTVFGKVGAGYVAGTIGGFTSRQSFNAGVALVAHGEFTIILAQVAAQNPQVSPGSRADLVAFAGLYVLATATVGMVLMRESKRIGRFLFRPPTLTQGT